MKKVNFWKTLFLSALAVTAFTGCSNDDSENDGGMPSITVMVRARRREPWI